MKYTSKIMLFAVLLAAIMSSCSTTTVTIQPVDYRTEYNQYQFNSPSQPDTIKIK